jgi:hypothetical protein
MLLLKQANGGGGGGAIFAESCNYTFRNVIFENNAAIKVRCSWLYHHICCIVFFNHIHF